MRVANKRQSFLWTMTCGDGPPFGEDRGSKRGVSVDPKNLVALVNLGTAYYADGQKGKAAPLFKKALELNPDHPEKPSMQKMIEEGESRS